MNEWGFAGDIKTWWETAAEVEPSWDISRCAIEETAEGQRKRADLTVFDVHNRPILVIELRLPDHQNPSPFDMRNIRDAVSKAQKVGARWAATSDGGTFLLVDTHLSGPLPTRVKAPMSLRTPATRGDLDVPAKREAIKAAWIELLGAVGPILAGLVTPPSTPPDEVFVESLRALLARPVAAIRDTVSAKKDASKQFSDDLVRWMVDQQGWAHEQSEYENEIQRVANVSAYVFTTRLLFYEALRRAQPSLTDLTMPPTVVAATATVKAIFDSAQAVSGDYQTVFTFDEICTYALISDEAVEGWQRVLDHLGQFELDAISYDVLGRLFERLIDPRERYEWGQHYTSPDVVDLMLSLALPDGTGPLMDPALGGGTFLVRGYIRKRVLLPGSTHQDRLAELAGCDQSAFAASIATVSLASRDLSFGDNYPQIRASSFFQRFPGQPWIDLPGPTVGGTGTPVARPVTLPKMRAVVCNPPYIGYKNTGDGRRREADGALGRSRLTPARLGGRYNYHLYFWFHSVTFLEDDGRLVFITSGEWLDSDYGVQLQRWLLEHTHIEAIIESLSEPWFSEARVGTVVVSAQRRTGLPADQFAEPTRFVTLRKPLRTLYGCTDGESDLDHIAHVDGFRDRVLALVGTAGESADLDWTTVPQNSLFELGER